MSRFITLLCCCLILSISAVSAVENPLDTIDWSNASPAQIHARLAMMKSQSFVDKSIRQSLTAAAVPSTQTNYDVQFYDVTLDFDWDNAAIAGHVTFLARATEDGINEVQVDLYSNMPIDSIIAGNGSSLVFTRDIHVVIITLDQTYNTDEQFTFTIYYYGNPVNSGGDGLVFTQYGTKPLIYSKSESYHARSWWPCKDRNDDKPDSMHMALTAATNFDVVSNGILDSTILNPNATRTYYFREIYPIVTYLFSVCISEYEFWSDVWNYNGITMPIEHYIYSSWLTQSQTDYAITPDVLTYLSDNYVTYPFHEEKYGHAQWTWGGAMEHQTISSMSASSWGMSEAIIAHEMGHQWWGDAITCKGWGHIWINEGWASYSEALVRKEIDGWPAYHDYMQSFLQYREYYWGREVIFAHDTTDEGEIFDLVVYDKGAWVCHMLRRQMGDPMFFAAIDSLFNSEYYMAAVNTEEFRDLFEAVSGEELDEFFNDWIYGGYQPNYWYSYYQEPAPGGGYDLYIAVDQTQTTAPMVFDMYIDMAISRDDLVAADTVRMFNNQRKQVFHLSQPDSITNLELDPEEWILRYAYLVDWTFRVITEQAEISAATQLEQYADTIHGIGSSNTIIYVISGALPSGITIGNDGVISGTTNDPIGDYAFTIQFIDNSTGQYEIKDYFLTVLEGFGVPGDVDGNSQLDVSDLLYMVDFFFDDPPGPAPANPVLADVNADCQMDISDLLYLVDYFFAEPAGPAPQIGCAK